MKITHNKVGQNLNVVESNKKDKAEKTKSAGIDIGSTKDPKESLDIASKVEVSPRAQEAKRIKDLAMSAPDVDQAKVEKFRKLIDEKKYEVNSKKVADKMVDDHLETAE